MAALDAEVRSVASNYYNAFGRVHDVQLEELLIPLISGVGLFTYIKELSAPQLAPSRMLREKRSNVLVG